MKQITKNNLRNITANLKEQEERIFHTQAKLLVIYHTCISLKKYEHYTCLLFPQKEKYLKNEIMLIYLHEKLVLSFRITSLSK